MPAVEIIKRVAFDPTTYGPAAISFGAHRLDWSSSQVFFQRGFFENNPDFTISGMPHDTPIGYGAGNRKILVGTLGMLGTSLVNNAASAIVERLVMNRFPDHRKLVRTLGWIERGLLASYWSYSESAHHFRQWRSNEQMARQLGFK